MNNNVGESYVSFELTDSNTFKPLDGTSCLGVTLKNNTENSLIFNLNPARPDIFIVSPDYGELPSFQEKLILLEIVHGFTTFVWAKDATSHPFTLTVRSNGGDAKGIIQTSHITTEVDTKNGREGVKALTKAVSALQTRILQQNSPQEPTSRASERQDPAMKSDPEIARRLRQENRQLLNKIERLAVAEDAITVQSSLYRLGLRTTPSSGSGRLQSPPMFIFEVNTLKEEEKELNNNVSRLRWKLEWRETTDTGRMGENGKPLISATH